MPDSNATCGISARRAAPSGQGEIEIMPYAHSEVATVADFLDTLPNFSLAERDVLEIVSPPFPAMLRENMNGHRVVAVDCDDNMLDLPVRSLDEQGERRPHAMEATNAAMWQRDVRVKAVCILSASISSLAPDKRPHVITRAAGHLPPGGALIVSVDQVLPQVPATRTTRLHSGTELIDEFKHRDRAWRRILRRRQEEMVLDLHLVTPEDLVRDIHAAGLIVVMQHSTPDPDQPFHVRAVLGAINRGTEARP